jgi:hypothetical protein
MNSFYEHHEDSIQWLNRCFGRILLNGLIQPFQQPERVVAFFNTYRQLYPVTRYALRDIGRGLGRRDCADPEVGPRHSGHCCARRDPAAPSRDRRRRTLERRTRTWRALVAQRAANRDTW